MTENSFAKVYSLLEKAGPNLPYWEVKKGFGINTITLIGFQNGGSVEVTGVSESDVVSKLEEKLKPATEKEKERKRQRIISYFVREPANILKRISNVSRVNGEMKQIALSANAFLEAAKEAIDSSDIDIATAAFKAIPVIQDVISCYGLATLVVV